jgi:hypothetical protein
LEGLKRARKETAADGGEVGWAAGEETDGEV